MKQVRKLMHLQEWRARRGARVWVQDVLAVDPDKRGSAKAEMLRRARAVGHGFGHSRDDFIEKVADKGVALRWEAA
jgi:hypothetical protein